MNELSQFKSITLFCQLPIGEEKENILFKMYITNI